MNALPALLSLASPMSTTLRARRIVNSLTRNRYRPVCSVASMAGLAAGTFWDSAGFPICLAIYIYKEEDRPMISDFNIPAANQRKRSNNAKKNTWLHKTVGPLKIYESTGGMKSWNGNKKTLDPIRFLSLEPMGPRVHMGDLLKTSLPELKHIELKQLGI